MNKISQSIVVVGILLALISSASLIPAAHAKFDIRKPYYTRGDSIIGNTPYHFVGIAAPDTNCYDRLYFRGTPRDANSILLNSQFIYNLNPSDTSPGKQFPIDLYFVAKKASQSPVNQLRFYIQMIMYEGQGEVVKTFYFDWKPGVYTYKINNGNPVVLKTNPELCHDDDASRIQQLQKQQQQQPSQNRGYNSRVN